MRRLVELPFAAKHDALVGLFAYLIKITKNMRIIIILVAIPIHVEDIFVRDKTDAPKFLAFLTELLPILTGQSA